MTLRTIVCEQEALFAQALASALSRGGAHVTATVTRAEDVARALRAGADRVVVNLDLDDDVLALVGTAARTTSGLRVVATHAGRTDDVGRRARAAGADAVVDTRITLDRLVACVLAPPRATTEPSELSVATLIPRRREPTGPDGELLLARFLTPRERQTLRMLASGASTQDMVTTLGVSTATARGYVQSVLSKLGVHTRLQAAAYAVRHGLLEQEVEAVGSVRERLSS